MDVHSLHDAISLLPEEMLIPVDAMRQKKRVSWRSLVAVAACFCLMFGLWLFRPLDKASGNTAIRDGITENSANNSGGGLMDKAEEYHSEVTIGFSLMNAKVIAVEETYLLVTLFSSGESATVYTEKLQELPSVKVGDTVSLTFPEAPKDLKNLYPTQINISQGGLSNEKDNDLVIGAAS